ncbi:MAG: OadG family protein [Deltaproteobacteria bacterium]|nr:OadG family protein [Deltaproteobacteria bacterium]
MKKYMILSLVLFLIFPAFINAEDFLGAPVIPNAETIVKTDARYEFKIKLSHDEILAFYREALEGNKDIAFRDWKEDTYIEDDGALPWHSITISKIYQDGWTSVRIVKDNWTWIIGTLILRFIAVFVVLIILFICMSISGRIISNFVKKMEAKKAAG